MTATNPNTTKGTDENPRQHTHASSKQQRPDNGKQLATPHGKIHRDVCNAAMEAYEAAQ